MPQVGADSPGQSTAPALNEYMSRRGRRRQLVHRFGAHDGISGHDCSRNFSVAGPCRVGDKQPAVCRSILRRLACRFPVIPWHTHHLGTKCLDCALSAGAYFCVHVDHAFAANVSGAPGDRPSVVTIRCGDHSDFGGGFAQLSRHQSINISRCTAAHGNFLGHTLQYCVSATQRFEAAQPKPGCFIFVEKLPDANLICKGREGVQWRRRVGRPRCDRCSGPGAGSDVQC